MLHTSLSAPPPQHHLHSPRLTPGCGPFSRLTPGCGPFSRLTPGCGPFSLLTPGCGPFSRFTPGCGPFSHFTPGCGPFSRFTPGCGPFSRFTPGCGPFSRLTPGCGLFSAWIGALQISMTLGLSPVASICIDLFGVRTAAFWGALVATVGLLASSFVTSLEMLYLTYGVLLGGGSSFIHMSFLVILGQYFRRHLGFVMGVAASGSSLATMVLPFLLQTLLARFGLRNTIRVMAAVMSSLMVCSLVWKPLHAARPTEVASSEDEDGGFMRVVRRILNVNIWKKRAFVVWAVSLSIAQIGYFVPFVHLVSFLSLDVCVTSGELERVAHGTVFSPLYCIGVCSASSASKHTCNATCEDGNQSLRRYTAILSKIVI